MQPDTLINATSETCCVVLVLGNSTVREYNDATIVVLGRLFNNFHWKHFKNTETFQKHICLKNTADATFSKRRMAQTGQTVILLPNFASAVLQVNESVEMV